MPDLDRRPACRLTQAQATDLLGVSTARVAELVGEGKLTPVAQWAKAGLLRADMERRTLERWKPGDPTWLTTTEVAAALGVTQPRVSQLARRGFLPFERAPDGRRVFRPGQVEVVARLGLLASDGNFLARNGDEHEGRRVQEAWATSVACVGRA